MMHRVPDSGPEKREKLTGEAFAQRVREDDELPQCDPVRARGGAWHATTRGRSAGTIVLAFQTPPAMRAWIEVPEIRTEWGESVGYEPAMANAARNEPGWRKVCQDAPREPWNPGRGWMKVTLTRTDPGTWVRELGRRIERECGAPMQMRLL